MHKRRSVKFCGIVFDVSRNYCSCHHAADLKALSRAMLKVRTRSLVRHTPFGCSTNPSSILGRVSVPLCECGALSPLVFEGFDTQVMKAFVVLQFVVVLRTQRPDRLTIQVFFCPLPGTPAVPHTPSRSFPLCVVHSKVTVEAWSRALGFFAILCGSWRCYSSWSESL